MYYNMKWFMTVAFLLMELNRTLHDHHLRLFPSKWSYGAQLKVEKAPQSNVMKIFTIGCQADRYKLVPVS